jgi:hypothetical protein
VDVPDPHQHADSFADLHARQREVKASGIILHLLKAETECRYCKLPVRVNVYGEWLDAKERSKWCHAPGFHRARVPHKPDPWTVERLANADRATQLRLAREAGQRPPSEATWAKVVELFPAAQAEHLAKHPPVPGD